jgi:hypothetical protein
MDQLEAALLGRVATSSGYEAPGRPPAIEYRSEEYFARGMLSTSEAHGRRPMPQA